MTQETIQEVRELNSRLSNAQDDAARFEAERGRLGDLHEQHLATMGFRERYLGARFGGDRNKLAVDDTLRARMHRAEQQMLDSRLRAQQYQERITEALEAELLRDPAYAKLCSLLGKARAAAQEVADFLGLVQRAAWEIKGAESTNTLDAMFSSSALSVLDYLDTDSARVAIQDVQNHVPRLRQSVADYKLACSGIAEASVPDGALNLLDLVVDLGFDFDFGFLDILQMGELSKAASQMRSIQEQAQEICNELSEQAMKLDQARRSALQQARSQCA